MFLKFFKLNDSKFSAVCIVSTLLSSVLFSLTLLLCYFISFPISNIAKIEYYVGAFAFIVIITIGIFMRFMKTKPYKKYLILGTVALLDCLLIITPFVKAVPHQPYIKEYSDHLIKIKKEMNSLYPNDYRILSLPGAIPEPAIAIHGFRSVTGKHANAPEAIRTFIGKNNEHLFKGKN